MSIHSKHSQGIQGYTNLYRFIMTVFIQYWCTNSPHISARSGMSPSIVMVKSWQMLHRALASRPWGIGKSSLPKFIFSFHFLPSAWMKLARTWQTEEAEQARYTLQFFLEKEAYMAKWVDPPRNTSQTPFQRYFLLSLWPEWAWHLLDRIRRGGYSRCTLFTVSRGGGGVHS